MDLTQFYIEPPQPGCARLVLPVVHMNGTSRAALVEQLEFVYAALATVSQALREASPNLRDYYPAGGQLWDDATAQHRRRQQLVVDLQDEIERQMGGILDRNPERS